MFGNLVNIVVPAVWAVAQSAAPAARGSGDPVLIIHGVCREAKASTGAGACTAVVGRRQFDDLLNIVAPGRQATPAMKQSFARAYAELLALDRAARDSGIDASQQYRETMQWLQQKTLADMLRRRLEKESDTISDAEIEAYYRERISRFETVKLRRLLLPKSNFAAADPIKFEQESQRIAARLRERAADGEDLERLQKEGYEALAFPGAPPATEVGDRRRADLPSEVCEEIFSLKPGEVSSVRNEKHSFVIYQVEARSRLSVNQVTEEIRREISRQKLEQALKAITAGIRAEFDETYFGTRSAQ